MTTRVHRWLKRITLAAAAFPIFQTTAGCDPFAINNLINQQMAFSIFGTFVGATQSYIGSHFPSADIIQLFLGGNQTPFITN